MAASVGPGTRTKTKKKHFVPQRVKVLRSADPLLGVLGWGINHQISELSQVPQPVMLLPDDFKANSKIKVNNHLFNRENLPGHFKFKEYCPQVFRNLRERFNIDDQDYLVSLTRSPPTYETEGGGRFLLSYDRTVVIKEISSEDVADMHSLLSHYHQYIVKCHGSTLLPQFLGMYRLSVDSEESYMLVMRNMFSHRLTVHRKYDLKHLDSRASMYQPVHPPAPIPALAMGLGFPAQPPLAAGHSDVDGVAAYVATEWPVAGGGMTGKYELLPRPAGQQKQGSLVSREASDKEKGKELPTLKDIDFLNMNQKVYISEEAKRDFMEKLKRDVEFLVQLKIMGYSLLLGIHDVQRAEQEDEEEVEEEEGDGEPTASVGSYGTSPEGIGSYLNSHKPLGPGDFDPYIDVYAIKSAENSPQKEVYFMGLIDILTQYDARKKAAHAAKTVKHGAGAEISTVHPEQYAKRFLDFVTNIFA